MGMPYKQGDKQFVVLQHIFTTDSNFDIVNLFVIIYKVNYTITFEIGIQV